MKTRILSIAFLILTAASCQQNMEEPIQQIDNTFRLFAVQDNGDDSKTVISGEKSVYWDPAEEIKVFKSDGSGFLFKSSNTEPVASAVFSGALSKDEVEEGEELWAVYPFAEEATFDGESITTVLPSEQVARAESFGRNMNLSIAKTTSTQLRFYNVGGGIRFTVTQEGVKKVVFEGLNGEIISGKVTVGFEEGVPVVKEVTGGSMFITLLPPEGETFQKGKWYYIVAIPGALSGGYKLRFYKDDDYAKKVSETPVTIKRAVFGSVVEADKENEYESVVTTFPETEEEWETTESKINDICSVLHSFVNSETVIDATAVACEAMKIESVVSAEPSKTGDLVYLQMDNGVYVNVQVQDDKEVFGSSLSYPGEMGERIIKQFSNEVSSYPSGKKALVLLPLYDEVIRDVGEHAAYLYDNIISSLKACGYEVKPYYNNQASLELFRGSTFEKYDVVYFNTHGSHQAMMADGTITTAFKTGSIVKSNEGTGKRWGALPTYFLPVNNSEPYYWISTEAYKYDSPSFNSSWIFMHACNGLTEGELERYFLKRGAAACSGFLTKASKRSSVDFAADLILALACGMEVQEASYWTIKHSVNQYGELWTQGGSWDNFCTFRNENLASFYLFNPTPCNLNSSVSEDQVFFSWEQPNSLGKYGYTLVINDGHSDYRYQVGSDKEFVLYLGPGKYSWYIQSDLYMDNDVVETFKSETKSFTIDPPKTDKPVKSMSLTTDSPNAYFNSIQASFVYDSQGRLVGFSGDDGNGNDTVVYNYTYSGNTMTYSDNGSAKLNSQGQFSAYTWYGNTFQFNYDSSNRLTSLSLGNESINYKWKGNDIYSILYSDPSYYESDMPSNPHFEPSPYNAPTTGVDINLVMRIFMAEIGLEELVVDGNFLAMMPGLIGKRSEHVLGLQFDTYERSSVDSFEAFSQYKGKDGNWHAITPDVLYNWKEGYGSFEVKGTKFLCKQESKPWVWTTDSDGAVIRAKWPLVFSYGNVSATLVVSTGTYDRDGNGVIDEYDATFSIKNGRVTSITSTGNFSYNFTFGY